MDNENLNIILARWIEGNITENELKVLQKEYDLDFLKKMLQKTESFCYPRYDIETEHNQFVKKLKKHNSTKFLSIRFLLKVAAAVLFLSIGTWIVSNKLNTVSYQTKYAEHKKIKLPDGSSIELNADSKIIYNKKEWSSNRQIKLKGEAFFKVKKGSTFTVETTKGEVKVLGTKFNIFDRKNIYKTFCFEGSVRVTLNKRNYVLTKGEGISKINKKINHFKNQQIYPSWISGKLEFEQIILKEVFNEITRQYNIGIKAEKIDISRQFSGYLPTDNLESALIILSKSMQFEYSFSKDNKYVIITNSK